MTPGYWHRLGHCIGVCCPRSVTGRNSRGPSLRQPPGTPRAPRPRDRPLFLPPPVGMCPPKELNSVLDGGDSRAAVSFSSAGGLGANASSVTRSHFGATRKACSSNVGLYGDTDSVADRIAISGRCWRWTRNRQDPLGGQWPIKGTPRPSGTPESSQVLAHTGYRR